MVTIPTFIKSFPLLHSRVRYRDGLYFISARNGEWLEIREFVQPHNPRVADIYSQIGPDVWACLDFVCRNIAYRQDIGEFFQLPSETLATFQGDCEDSSILLVSMLRRFTNAYVVLGNYRGLGHAWVAKEGEILEATYTAAIAVPDPDNYCPYFLFNDQEVIELWPGGKNKLVLSAGGRVRPFPVDAFLDGRSIRVVNTPAKP